MGPPSLVILTGAGISAESGVSTFRDKDGVWAKIDYREVATPEGFARDPDKVHAFYNQRRRDMAHVKPNAAHLALARLEQEYAGEFLLVTQNIDDLHERAGSRKLIHMHGEIYGIFCAECGARRYWREDLSTELICGQCRAKGSLRPDVVWFDERPYRLEEIYKSLSRCDLFVAIGTSGTVHPAAGFVQEAKEAGAHTIHLNLERSDGPCWFDDVRIGPAAKHVPSFVEEMLGASGMGASAG